MRDGDGKCKMDSGTGRDAGRGGKAKESTREREGRCVRKRTNGYTQDNGRGMEREGKGKCAGERVAEVKATTREEIGGESLPRLACRSNE